MIAWKTIDGFDGRYLITPYGNVISTIGDQPKVLKPCLRNGYPSMTLHYKNHTHKHFTIHKLVAEYFIGKNIKGLQVNHIDGDKTNNKWLNLEYVTHSENMKHAFKIGLQSNKGMNHSRSKLIDDDIREIRKLHKAGRSQGQLSKQYKIAQSTISRICNYQRWSHVE